MDLTAGNSLSVYSLDDTGAYRMVDDKTYTISEDGSIRVSLPEQHTYRLLNAAQSEEAAQGIYNTVKPQQKTAAVKKGKQIKMRFSSSLDLENVKSIAYTSSKKSVAKVSANGKITAKKAGTAVIQAKVMLKNGVEKTVSMKVSVK
ncbi:MAG: Ig-like domain-containing protein [Eubacterium sp.]|nr:Ig-like domain-containing protein [Eubacterium sp.]